MTIGDWVTFYPKRGAVKDAVIVSPMRLAGEVVGLGEWKKGSIPSRDVTIRGRSNRTLTVDLVDNYVTTHPNERAARDATEGEFHESGPGVWIPGGPNPRFDKWDNDQ